MATKLNQEIKLAASTILNKISSNRETLSLYNVQTTVNHTLIETTEVLKKISERQRTRNDNPISEILQ